MTRTCFSTSYNIVHKDKIFHPPTSAKCPFIENEVSTIYIFYFMLHCVIACSDKGLVCDFVGVKLVVLWVVRRILLRLVMVTV